MKEEMDGKSKEVHGTAKRREDVLGAVAAVMINKCAWGASLNACTVSSSTVLLTE